MRRAFRLRDALSVTLAAALALGPRVADACGCFAPPSPSVPVVQAAERILFSVKDGQVTAHVQIQYEGEAAEFGWLLPVPAVPTLELGVDELFTVLTNTTQPVYQLNTRFTPGCFSGGTGGTGGASFSGGLDAGAGGSGGAGGTNPVVVQDSIGPFDYAVLRADSKSEMLRWLADNRYFVPATSDDAIAPYIRPGGFFLALKLRSGKAAGDLQPIVLRYPSDVGMIPLILTSIGATENMGVQVWMLGGGRAIPRNYHHTVLNDAAIDWRSAGSNYNDVIIRAAGEAPGKHTFVTEYAGSSQPMRGVLAPPWRFGTEAELASKPTASAFLRHLHERGFATGAAPFNPLPSALRTLLARYLPVPQGVSADTYYRNFDAYPPAPGADFRPAEMASEIFQRYVGPMRAAGALFDEQPYLTRLYTTLSPADMNRDPVFSFNPALPAVSRTHAATMIVGCKDQRELDAVLVTEQGWRLAFPQGRFAPPALDLRGVPASLRIETLREEGPVEVNLDNTALVAAAVESPANQLPDGTPTGQPPSPDDPGPQPCGCAAAPEAWLAAAAAAALGCALRRRRRT